MSLPKVSVVVPVFNAGKSLIPSIQSLIQQTLAEIEVVVVNDGSTDETAQVVDQLARQYENITPLHLRENKGAHEARLAGLKLTSAPWIGFMDADDYARPAMFSTLLSHAVENDVDIVVCGADRVTKRREFISSKIKFDVSQRFNADIFEKFCSFEYGTGMLCNKFYKREVIEPWFDLHFRWRQPINEDLLLNIGCFYKARSVYLCEDILYEYVLNESSVTSKAKPAKSYVDTYRAAALAVDLYQDLGENILLKIIEMYRTQLSWKAYQVADLGSTMNFEAELRQAVEMIYETQPAALALLTARQQPEVIIGARAALKILIRKVISRLGLALPPK